VRLYPIGPILPDGGTLWVCDDVPPNAGIQWTLVSGGGTLTPTAAATNANGVASARYDAGGATVGTTVTVRAEVYA
jgi:hypothetical protein